MAELTTTQMHQHKKMAGALTPCLPATGASQSPVLLHSHLLWSVLLALIAGELERVHAGPRDLALALAWWEDRDKWCYGRAGVVLLVP